VTGQDKVEVSDNDIWSRFEYNGSILHVVEEEGECLVLFL